MSFARSMSLRFAYFPVERHTQSVAAANEEAKSLEAAFSFLYLCF